MMLLQVLPIETANWVIAVLLAVLSFMLWRYINRLDKKQDSNDAQMKSIGEILVKHEAKHDTHEKEIARIWEKI